MLLPLEYHSDGKYKYSTALMFSYINIFKPKKVKLDINKLSKNLYYECWKNNARPIDVMNDMKNKKYEDEVKRIKKSNTKFPIIIDTKLVQLLNTFCPMLVTESGIVIDVKLIQLKNA